MVKINNENIVGLINKAIKDKKFENNYLHFFNFLSKATLSNVEKESIANALRVYTENGYDSVLVPTLRLHPVLEIPDISSTMAEIHNTLDLIKMFEKHDNDSLDERVDVWTHDALTVAEWNMMSTPIKNTVVYLVCLFTHRKVIESDLHFISNVWGSTIELFNAYFDKNIAIPCETGEYETDKLFEMINRFKYVVFYIIDLIFSDKLRNIIDIHHIPKKFDELILILEKTKTLSFKKDIQILVDNITGVLDQKDKEKIHIELQKTYTIGQYKITLNWEEDGDPELVVIHENLYKKPLPFEAEISDFTE